MKRGLGTATSTEALEIVFVQISKLYLSKLPNVFLNCKIYLSKSTQGVEFEKRAWNSHFNGGVGKRAWNSHFNGGLGVEFDFLFEACALEYQFICHRDKLFLKARERGTAISMEGSGSELGTRGSQVI